MTLQQLIAKHGSSELARMVGVHRSVISHYASDRRSLGHRLAAKIAKGTGTKLSFDGKWIFKSTRR